MLIWTIDEYFSVKEIRNNIINELKNRGYEESKIDELIKICDEAYNDYKIPYPTINEILKDDK